MSKRKDEIEAINVQFAQVGERFYWFTVPDGVTRDGMTGQQLDERVHETNHMTAVAEGLANRLRWPLFGPSRSGEAMIRTMEVPD